MAMEGAGGVGGRGVGSDGGGAGGEDSQSIVVEGVQAAVVVVVVADKVLVSDRATAPGLASTTMMTMVHASTDVTLIPT